MLPLAACNAHRPASPPPEPLVSPLEEPPSPVGWDHVLRGGLGSDAIVPDTIVDGGHDALFRFDSLDDGIAPGAQDPGCCCCPCLEAWLAIPGNAARLLDDPGIICP
jgi:hypothetical protein